MDFKPIFDPRKLSVNDEIPDVFKELLDEVDPPKFKKPSQAQRKQTPVQDDQKMDPKYIYRPLEDETVVPKSFIPKVTLASTQKVLKKGREEMRGNERNGPIRITLSLSNTVRKMSVAALPLDDVDVD